MCHLEVIVVKAALYRLVARISLYFPLAINVFYLSNRSVAVLFGQKLVSPAFQDGPNYSIYSAR